MAKRERELRPGSETCECESCLRWFSTTANFDRHREGRYDDDSRRCLTNAEMEAKGMFERGGVWRRLPAQNDAYVAARRSGAIAKDE